jgi:uncharacterized protein YqeY
MTTELVQHRLRQALGAAMKARDTGAVPALRSALARLDDAQAVDVPTLSGTALAVERTPLGVGAAEVPRRELSEDAAVALVRREIAEREEEAARYDAAGMDALADRSRTGADALRAVLGG